MYRSLRVLAVVLCALGNLPAMAQNPGEDSLRLNLRGRQPATVERPGLGEFSLSLGSDILPERPAPFLSDRYQTLLPRLVDQAGEPTGPQSSRSMQRHERSVGRPYTSILTLQTPLLDEGDNESIKAQTRSGRWAVYGEFSQETIPRLPRAVASAGIGPQPVANRLPAPESLTGAPEGLVAPKPGNEPTAALAANRYHLEAVYDFLPSVQGKVSYNRSVIETLDRQEKLQVEGTVSAGPDVLIKAGYRNETLPEANERQPSKDTKVWTEFILKF
jgi:hypothetical protein